MLNEKIRLEQTYNGVRKDNESLLANVKDLDLSNESVKRKMEDL